MKLKFKNTETEYDVNFKRIASNVVQLLGEFPIETTGFTLSREGKSDNWDYSNFTTVYREIEGGVQFSNDGSVYVEPEEIEVQPEPTYDGVTLEEVSEKVDMLTDCVLEMSIMVYE